MIEYNLEELKKSIEEMKNFEQSVLPYKIIDCPDILFLNKDHTISEDEEIKSIEDYTTKIREEYKIVLTIK